MAAKPQESQSLKRLLFLGWVMYAVSFLLPLLEMWGYNAFWTYFQMFFAFEEDAYPSILAVNLSNVLMISSPLLVRVMSARTLGLLILFGGLHNSRFLWEVCDELSDLTELFPAYYVWWTSFFVVSSALLTSSKGSAPNESAAEAT